MMSASKVIVVGAGIAGLVSAYELNKHGHDVIVLEASQRVGGRMITDCSNGYLIDGGAQFLSSAYQILSGIIEELGISSEYLETNRSVGIVRHGRIHKFRYDNAFSLLTGGLLDFGEWLSLGIGGFRLLRKTNKLPINDYSAWIEFDDEAAESWSNGYYGNTITEYFVEPLLEAFYFQSPSDTSKALPIAINAFGAHKAKTMTLANGIGSLPEQMAKELDVRLNTPVSNVLVTPDGVSVAAPAQRFEADRVILATPAYVSKDIYRSPSALERKLLITTYSSTVNIAIALKSKLSKEMSLDDIYGVWVPRAERKVIAAFTIESRKETDRAGSGELVHVMLSGEAGKMMVEQDESHIFQKVLAEIDRYIPGISEKIAFTRVYRWKNAEPSSPVGRCKAVFEYRNGVNTRNKVVLAGDYLGMPFTEGAAETGHWAASIVNMA